MRLQAAARRWRAQRERWSLAHAQAQLAFERAQLALSAMELVPMRVAEGLDWGMVFQAQSELAQRFGPQFADVVEGNLALSRARAAEHAHERATPVHSGGGPYWIL